MTQGVPFRTWAWLDCWWQHYGPGHELFVLAVFDPRGALVGLAPWFLEPSATRGRVVQFLGSGHVCSDYLSVLASAEHEDAVTAALAQWLADPARQSDENRWDLLHLSGVAASDRAVAKLVAYLAEEGCAVHRRSGLNCWRIELPDTWDDYLATLSKTFRKQLRRADRQMLESGQAVLRTAANSEELDHGMQILVDLHQRRRRTLGQPGCFACPRFSAFLHQAAPGLLAEERLQLHWIELDGRPVSAEFHLAGGHVTYAYQAGVDPDALESRPGWLMNIATIRKAIREGQQGFDWLRGDEPYKAHWRARPRPCLELRVAAPRPLAQLRHGVWLAGDRMKHWIRSSLSLAGMH